MTYEFRRVKGEEGQALVMVALAMGFFLIAAVGLGIDGSHLYSQHQMAQSAADATAQAAMMSIFDGTNTSGTASFAAADKGSLTCSNTTSTPCAYANLNGFSSTNGDTITLKFYNADDAPASLNGVAVSDSATDPVSIVQVTISRPVRTFLVRFAGPTSTTIYATATAAIVKVVAPTPLLVTDPNNNVSLTASGNPTITICGGPTQSVQVNSTSSSAYDGNGTVDLSHAGPNDSSGNCTGTGNADFGTFGGKSTNPGVNFGSGTGKYLYPSSPILDPFAGVSPPSNPGTAAPATASIAKGTDGCTNNGGCTEYSPGLYTGGISATSPGKYYIFKPGVYYINGGGLSFKHATGGGANNSAMCVGCTADPDTGTGLLFYDTGTADAKGFAQTAGFDFNTGNNISFVGPTLTQVLNGQTVPAPPYYNIAMWEDRTAEAHYGNGQTSNGGAHNLGQGTGCFQVTGTIYITNTRAIMANSSDSNYPHHVQYVNYGGNPCSNTVTQGDIIVSDLNMNGTQAAIKMNLVPYGFLKVRQVALVN
ncbi:MAG TPA: pilus assembly protein TadG-related protein [Acidobacteriaceae bacterium]|nr:pilus assembly protein TadG-related protein [Acidobacteriaceae bacterium]